MSGITINIKGLKVLRSTVAEKAGVRNVLSTPVRLCLHLCYQ